MNQKPDGGTSDLELLELLVGSVSAAANLGRTFITLLICVSVECSDADTSTHTFEHLHFYTDVSDAEGIFLLLQLLLQTCMLAIFNH